MASQKLTNGKNLLTKLLSQIEGLAGSAFSVETKYDFTDGARYILVISKQRKQNLTEEEMRATLLKRKADCVALLNFKKQKRYLD